jgi:hypothetical protein
MSSLLLNVNLDMLYAEMKATIYHEFGWNYNTIDVEITWRCQISEHQYYLVSIMCDGSFKTMIDSFIQSGLNMMVLYMSNQSRSDFFSTFVGPSKLVSRGKNNLLSDDLLQKIYDTMFDNPFPDQHRFDYSEPGDNKDDDTLDPNMMVNVDDDIDNNVDDDIDDEIIPYVPEFGDASGSSFVISND